MPEPRPSLAANRVVRERARLAMFAALALGLLLPAAWAGPEDVLRDYVRAPDPVYGYRRVETLRRPGCTLHVLQLASQRWRTHAEVDRVLWKHWMAVVVPDGVRGDVAMLIVEGGTNTRFPPGVHNPVVAAAEYIAKTTRTAVVALGQVPNEPLRFPDAAGGLMEDELVAYTWAKAMATGDYTWPAYVPMVKSVVRAMDAAQDYLARDVHHPVQRFVLVGFSKRGAATWLTAAVDARVMALASGVFDVLDIVAQIERHYEAYGEYAPELHAYVDDGVVQRLRSPEGRALLRTVDPYFYLDAIRQPKFLINATGDPFFLPDAALQYIDRLRGETLLRYVPNSDHTLRNRKTSVMDIVDGLVSWYENLLADVPRPRIAWSVTDGRLRVQSSPAPQAALLWRASDATARDFRKRTIGESWVSTPLAPDARGESTVALAPPKRGWRAYFVELHYPGLGGLPQVYSTPVFVVPEGLPHALADPVVRPRDAAFWQDAVAHALRHDLGAEISPWRVAGYFPMPLFDADLPDLASAARVMDDSGSAMAAARRECLATRLNIAHGDLGWYSRLTLTPGTARYLWQWYDEADGAFRHGDPPQARALCAGMNAAGTAETVAPLAPRQ